MKTSSITLLFLLVGFGVSTAQSFKTDSIAKREVLKLSFIVGQWQGSGWTYSQDRSRHTFDQSESISFKLDSTAILIEGVGTNTGKVIHNALAVITWNSEQNNYSFNSYMASGRKGQFRGELVGNQFHWYINDNLRYIIFINDKGQWYEKGEMNQGGNWFQFFEMTLDKK